MFKYKDNDIHNSQFLFHGSPKLLDIIEQRQAHDSNNNPYNDDFAVFLTSSFFIASAYAFKDKIKEISTDKNWNFDIGYDSDNNEIYIEMDNINIDDDMEGYIYVFPFDKSYEHFEKSIQYKCHKDIKPVDIVKIKFSDFKYYYNINQVVKHR